MGGGGFGIGPIEILIVAGVAGLLVLGLVILVLGAIAGNKNGPGK